MHPEHTFVQLHLPCLVHGAVLAEHQCSQLNAGNSGTAEQLPQLAHERSTQRHFVNHTSVCSPHQGWHNSGTAGGLGGGGGGLINPSHSGHLLQMESSQLHLSAHDSLFS